MNKKILIDLLDIKHEISKEVMQHLSPETGETVKRLEYEFIKALNEATKVFLDKTEKPREVTTPVKKVAVE